MNLVQQCRPLLDAIRLHEGKTYGQIYYGAKGVPRDTDCSKLTLNGVLDLQQRMKNAGSASTACGAYQFLRKTLVVTIQQMGLSGYELWARDLQDQMAIHLMKGRGLEMFIAGKMNATDFANSLAREWASLPVVSAIKGGAGFLLKPGQSYYAGDGLNKSFHAPEVILALMTGLRAEGPQQAAPPQVMNDAVAARPAPAPPLTAARGFWARLWHWDWA